jgi:chorismate synthase
MAGNTFGQLLKLTTFGESHGRAIGGVLDGLPAGVEINEELLRQDMRRRKPGQSDLVTPRKEADEVEILSGVYEGVSLGTPIGFLVWNKDTKPGDYKHIAKAYRPSHADFTYEEKYGIRDHRGGGRSSARETVSRVVGGAFAKMLLETEGIMVTAYVSRIGGIEMDGKGTVPTLEEVEASPVRCPDPAASAEMIDLIRQTKEKGDTLGGEITCVVSNMPVGLGDPVFDKLHADLGKAMMSINAVKGFEIGSGFSSSFLLGSENNDEFVREDGKIKTLTNHSGGIQGGISNGMDIIFNTAFKPVSTLMKDQQSVDKDGKETVVKGKGRHDVTVLPRAVPIVEAMAALVVGDHLLRNKISRI